jgi:hypothetical protein
MSNDTLALYCSSRKHHAATAGFCQSAGMGGQKKEPKSDLQRLFVQRLTEEQGERSDKELAAASKGRISQTMISAIKRFHHDLTLEKVSILAEALGFPPWYLLTKKDQVEQTVIRPPSNVVRLPDPYPKIFGRKNGEQQAKKSKRRR